MHPAWACGFIDVWFYKYADPPELDLVICEYYKDAAPLALGIGSPFF